MIKIYIKRKKIWFANASLRIRKWLRVTEGGIVGIVFWLLRRERVNNVKFSFADHVRNELEVEIKIINKAVSFAQTPVSSWWRVRGKFHFRMMGEFVRSQGDERNGRDARGSFRNVFSLA